MYKRIKHRHQIKEIALLISLMGLQNLVYADNVIAFDGDEVTIQGGSYEANNSLGAAIIAREGRLTNINNELILINNRGTEGGNGANLQVNGHFSSPDQKLTINVNSLGSSIAVRAVTGSVFDFSNSTVRVDSISQSSTSGFSAYGFYLTDQGTTAKIGNDSTINVQNLASASYGVQSFGGSEFISGDNLKLDVSSQSNSTGGLIARSSGKISVGDNFVANVSSMGNIAYALWAYTNSEIILGDDANISASATGSGTSAQGIVVRDLATVTVGKGLSIKATSENSSAFGIQTYDQSNTGSNNNTGGEVIVGENVYIEATSINAEAYGIATRGTGSSTTINGGTIIATLGQEYGSGEALRVLDKGNIIANTAKYTIYGNVVNTGGTLELNLGEGSYLQGASTLSGGGTSNLALTSSIWKMTKDSSVSKLALNNSVVDFAEDKTGSTLNVEELSGNGTFVMRTNIVGDSADKLVVTSSSSGNHNIRVLNRGSLSSTGNEVITLVETPDGLASFSLDGSRASRAAVELGGYQYDLRKNNTNWELFSSGKAAPITSTADASANFLNVGYMLNYAETQTLLQRMGELRQAENSQGDVWARAFTGKFDSFGGGKLSGFDMDYTGVQAGVDRRLNMTGADVYLGLMGGATKADSNYQEGDGNIDGYHFGLYGTYVAPNDFYVDGTLKYSHIKNKFNVKDSQYDRINGSASSDGYGLSIEVGKRFYFADAKTGYYIEPQAQLSYLHQDSSSTNADNGLVVDLDSYDSTLGRVSAIVGYEVKEGKNPVNVYFKTGYVTEMSGDVGYRLNGSPETHDFGGGWWENGIGVTTQLNKKHNLYLDGTYATGSKFDQMQINAGYRFSF